jgi:hypothetical protein
MPPCALQTQRCAIHVSRTTFSWIFYNLLGSKSIPLPPKYFSPLRIVPLRLFIKLRASIEQMSGLLFLGFVLGRHMSGRPDRPRVPIMDQGSTEVSHNEDPIQLFEVGGFTNTIYLRGNPRDIAARSIYWRWQCL